MRLDEVARANSLAERAKTLKTAHDLLARDVTATLSIPTGSFDAITGRNYESTLTLGGPARVELRRVVKNEHDRVAANLAELGVTVEELRHT